MFNVLMPACAGKSYGVKIGGLLATAAILMKPDITDVELGLVLNPVSECLVNALTMIEVPTGATLH